MAENNFIYNNNYLLSNLDAQKLYAQSPLTTGVSGSSAYIGIEPSARYNETVLWSGNCAYGQSLTASEAITGFERYKIYLKNTERQQQTVIEKFADPTINTADSNKIVTLECIQAGWSNNTFLTFNVGNGQWDNTWSVFNYNGGYAGYFYATSWNYLPLGSAYLPVIQKIIGINRKEV